MDNYGRGSDPVIGLGISYGSGGFKANVNLSIGYNLGDFSGAYGIGVTYHSNYYRTQKRGIEFRNSLMVSYRENSNAVSLGTNFWNGAGGLKEFKQRTGMFSVGSGDFIFSYENDGTPFQYLGLGDGNDSFRTAATSIGIGDVSLNMNLFTGRRDEKSFELESALPGGKEGIPEGKGKYGETYKHGFVIEEDPNYRYGGLTLNYEGLSVGVNSEWVRHTFQNVLAHDIIQPQRQFPMLSDDFKPVANISNQENSKFTSWGQ